MSVVEDVRGVIQDFLAPELRELKARVEALENKVDANEHRAERRHDEVMQAIRQFTDYNALSQHIARLESREAAH
jgi:predicted  nucleic acid-binding Zn-ribbon protein